MDSSILAFKVPSDLARRLELPMSDAEDSFEMHITLMMLGEPPASKREALEALLTSWCAAHSAISGTLGGVARFAPTPDSDSKEPLVVLFDSPDLPAWREGLFKQVDNLLDLKEEQTHGFIPHITIKYLSPDEGNPIQQIKREEITFPSVWLFWNDEQIEFTLSGSKKESVQMKEATQRDLADTATLLSDLGIRISDLQRSADLSQKTLLTEVLNLIIKAGDVLTRIPARESTTRGSEAIDPVSDLTRRLKSCADDLIHLKRNPNFESRISNLSLAAQSVRTAITYLEGGTPESVREGAYPSATAVLKWSPEVPEVLKQHSMWSEADYAYFREKGYSDEEIKELWDRDAKRGARPVKYEARESTLTGSQKAAIKGKIDAAVRSTLDAMIDLEADPSQSALKATLDRAAKMLQSVSARGIESSRTREQFSIEITDYEEFRDELGNTLSPIRESMECGANEDWDGAARSLLGVSNAILSAESFAKDMADPIAHESIRATEQLGDDFDVNFYRRSLEDRVSEITALASKLLKIERVIAMYRGNSSSAVGNLVEAQGHLGSARDLVTDASTSLEIPEEPYEESASSPLQHFVEAGILKNK